MEELSQRLREFGLELPSLIVPVAIVVVGWVLALLLSAWARRALHRTKLDDRVAERILGDERARSFESERWVGRFVYYVVLLLTLLAFLQAIELTAATEPVQRLLAEVFVFLPRLVAAAAIIMVAWMLATLTRVVLARASDRWDVDRRVAQASAEPGVEIPAGPTDLAVGRMLADAGYWLVLLLFAPAVLDSLGMNGLLEPVQLMFEEALGFLPNLASAALIGIVGWFVARVAQRLVTGLLAGAGVDRLSERVGLEQALGTLRLSALLGLTVQVLVLVPVAIAALGALQLSTITVPASDMLSMFFAAVPALFGAALLLAVAYVGGRLAGGLVSNLLDGLGFDRVLTKIGLAQEQVGKRTPSELVGGLAVLAIMYFAVVESARMLELTAFAELATRFAVLGGHILLGLVIFGFGLYLAKLAADAVERSAVDHSHTLGIVARAAVIVLGAAMGLRQMGIADEIIELAFALTLGAVAVATALAFGLGGRDVASETLHDLRDRMRVNETGGGHVAGGTPAHTPTGSHQKID